MPTAANRAARQRATLVIITALLFAAGIGLLLLPVKFPFPLRLLLGTGNLILALVLLAVVKQSPRR